MRTRITKDLKTFKRRKLLSNPKSEYPATTPGADKIVFNPPNVMSTQK